MSLLDDLKEREGYWKLKGGRTRWHCLENSLWERIWTCSKRDHGIERLCLVIGRGLLHRNRSAAAYGYNIDTEYRLSQRRNKNDDLYKICIDMYSKQNFICVQMRQN